MSGKHPEDIVILLDAKETFICDPERLTILIAGILEYIQKKIMEEAEDRFGLVSFSTKAHIHLNLETITQSAFHNAISLIIPFGRYSRLELGIAAAVQMLAVPRRALRPGSIPRVLIVSDDEFTAPKMEWEDMPGMLKNVGVCIDAIQVDGCNHLMGALERYAQGTGGTFATCVKVDFKNTIETLAAGNLPADIPWVNDRHPLPDELLKQIAWRRASLDSYVKSPRDLFHIVAIKKLCAICHTPLCIQCRKPALFCACFCPQCGCFMHIHCATGRAEIQGGPPGVLNCPECSFLLKLPQAGTECPSLLTLPDGSYHYYRRLKAHLRDRHLAHLYEQFYPLPKDPPLFATGVEIGARVSYDGDDYPDTRIVFRRGTQEQEVKCVHMVLYQGPIDSLPREEDLMRNLPGRSIHLAPVEHFFALKSYVAGIAEIGLGAMFELAFSAGNLPVGFNDLMQAQVINALLKLAPLELVNFIQTFPLQIQLNSMPVKEAVHNVLTSVKERLSGKILQFLAGFPDLEIKRLVAGHKDTPHEVLARLAEDDDLKVRRLVAHHRGTPGEVLDQLAGDDDAEIRQMVAMKNNTNASTITCLAADPCVNVRRAVAGRRNAPYSIFKTLVQDSDDTVRREAARNKRMPADLLEGLANDEDLNVRIEIARNACSPSNILTYLANACNSWVRAAVAGNRNAPSATLARMVGDSNDIVRREVAGNNRSPITAFAFLMSDKDKWVRIRVAENASTPQEFLAQLSEDEDASVRSGVAWNANTPANVLAALATDEDASVRGGVAWNTNAHANVLITLALDEEVGVRWEVAQNARTPEKTRAALAGDKDALVRRATEQKKEVLG